MVSSIGATAAVDMGSSCWLRRLRPRLPPVGLRAGAAHQHRALGLAEAIGLQERPDALLVAKHGVGAGPVRAPQAAVETPRVEDARQRIPDVRKRIRLFR